MRLRFGGERLEPNELISSVGAAAHVYGKFVCDEHLESHGPWRPEANRSGIHPKSREQIEAHRWIVSFPSVRAARMRLLVVSAKIEPSIFDLQVYADEN